MADLSPSAFAGVFHKPFAEQVAFFRAKLGNLVPTQFWNELQKAQHDRAFMVAGAEKGDLLQDLAMAIDKAIAQGTTYETFVKDFFAAVDKHDWHGWTGEATAAGRAWRTRVIYTTNTFTSYSAGRLAQLRAGNFALWVYRHTHGEEHPRPQHEAWDGLALPPDHPFWKTHYPPSGWGCRCHVFGARDAAGVRMLGGDPDKQLPENWDTIDPKTGEPVGIDEGWGYMPGDTVSHLVSEMAAKTQQWDYTIAKAYMQNVPADTRDALATAYRSLPSTATDARLYAQRALSKTTTAKVAPYQTLGLATKQQALRIDALGYGFQVSDYDFALDANDVRHAISGHGEDGETREQQVPINAADFAEVPRFLDSPWTALKPVRLRSTGRMGFQMTTNVGGRRYTSVWEVLSGRKMLALKSLWKYKL